MLLFSALAGIVLALQLSSYINGPPNHHFIEDPLYSFRSSRSCKAPPLQERSAPLTHSCIRLISSSATKLHFRITPPKSVSAVLYKLTLSTFENPHSPFAQASIASTSSYIFNYTATDLYPDIDYTVQLYKDEIRGVPLCRRSISTRSTEQNLVLNPSFETSGQSPHTATRFRAPSPSSPRHWTPFYNGHAGLVCFPTPYAISPHTGRCVLQVGDFKPPTTPPRFHGVHQGIRISSSRLVRISAWFRFVGTILSQARAVMIVSWTDMNARVYDGFSVPLSSNSAHDRWTRICAVVEAPTFATLSFVHVFFHIEDSHTSVLLIDDVSVVDVSTSRLSLHQISSGCYLDGQENKIRGKWKENINSDSHADDKVTIHLKSEIRPMKKQLTIAVPLTANRVLRLEAMSKLYGGGPITAAVVVQNAIEAGVFAEIWKRKAWLRKHIDVSFVRAYGEKEPSLFLNAVRNAAIRATTTKFVIMLDVDMTPGYDIFDCFRDINGTYLSSLLTSGEQRLVAVLPVFVSDTHIRAPKNKQEVLSQTGQRIGTSYCINSQRGSKGRRWYGQDIVIQTKFLPDYEPYAIVRRDKYPAYDERFSGYGFNKIAWAAGAESAGWKLVVINDRFVTHLNHAENDWVSRIDVQHYLQTWRRYLSYASEIDSPDAFRSLNTLISTV